MKMPLRLQKYLLKKKLDKKTSVENTRKKYYLSVLATFKNEMLNLDLWIRHYIWMGVDHFYLIDNGSTDNSLHVLKPYKEKGIVTILSLHEKYKQKENYIINEFGIMQ